MASYVEIIRLFLSSQTLDFRKNTPAYAGNTSDPSSTIPVFRDHPRLRGEYLLLFRIYNAILGSPPLARGIPLKASVKMLVLGITPACAGNTYSVMVYIRSNRDHPRLRGEYFESLTISLVQIGSPPLARGIRTMQRKRSGKTGITPACAGNTLLMNVVNAMSRDHPRLRGEYWYAPSTP